MESLLADRETLTNFLQGGDKPVITGMDALHFTEESSFMLDVLRLDVRFDYPTTTFTAAEGPAFAGESYELAIPDLPTTSWRRAAPRRKA